MKSSIAICFIVWCLMTLLLALSVVGLVVFIREDFSTNSWTGEQGEAAWFKIGKALTNKLIT